MSEHYHDVGDMRFLKEMGKLAPAEFKAWLGLDDIVRREDGAIPRKYRELIALGGCLHDPVSLLHRRARKRRESGGRDARGSDFPGRRVSAHDVSVADWLAVAAPSAGI